MIYVRGLFGYNGMDNRAIFGTPSHSRVPGKQRITFRMVAPFRVVDDSSLIAVNDEDTRPLSETLPMALRDAR